MTISLGAEDKGMYTLQFDATKFWSAEAGETSATAPLPTDQIEYINRDKIAEYWEQTTG